MPSGPLHLLKAAVRMEANDVFSTRLWRRSYQVQITAALWVRGWEDPSQSQESEALKQVCLKVLVKKKHQTFNTHLPAR